jgi:2-pyrone-4,6-dicarboxylate lactonase
VRFNFVRHLGGAPDMALFHRVVDRIRDLRWHVVLHLDGSDIVPLSEMIRKLPVPFVIDHMGRVPAAGGIHQPAFRALLDVTGLDNCWVKVSGSERISKHPFLAAVPMAQVLCESIPDRVLWGTDFPHPNLKESVDEADLVDLVPRFARTPEAQRRLLVDNPARLYDFGP